MSIFVLFLLNFPINFAYNKSHLLSGKKINTHHCCHYIHIYFHFVLHEGESKFVKCTGCWLWMKTLCLSSPFSIVYSRPKWEHLKPLMGCGGVQGMGPRYGHLFSLWEYKTTPTASGQTLLKSPEELHWGPGQLSCQREGRGGVCAKLTPTWTCCHCKDSKWCPRRVLNSSVAHRARHRDGEYLYCVGTV